MANKLGFKGSLDSNAVAFNLEGRGEEDVPVTQRVASFSGLVSPGVFSLTLSVQTVWRCPVWDLHLAQPVLIREGGKAGQNQP